MTDSPTITLDVGRRAGAPAEPRRGVPTTILATTAAATAVNVVIWAAGALAGGDFEYTDNGEVLSAAPGGVLVLTAVPLLVGLTVAALLARWRIGVVRLAQVVGSLLAVGTIGGTIASDFDGASTMALSLAHLAIVPFLWGGLDAIGKRISRRPGLEGLR